MHKLASSLNCPMKPMKFLPSVCIISLHIIVYCGKVFKNINRCLHFHWSFSFFAITDLAGLLPSHGALSKPLQSIPAGTVVVVNLEFEGKCLPHEVCSLCSGFTQFVQHADLGTHPSMWAVCLGQCIRGGVGQIDQCNHFIHAEAKN